jgi:hypothetical protein
MPDTKRPWPKNMGDLVLKTGARWQATYTTPGASIAGDPEQFDHPRYRIGGDWDNPDPVKVLHIECEERHCTDEDGHWRSYRGDEWAIYSDADTVTAKNFREAVRAAKQLVNP